MSYAGTYGPDETCQHDCYRQNCWRCNGSVERFARELPERLSHPAAAASIVIITRTITVYDASCPSSICVWTTSGISDEAAAKQAVDNHIADCRKVADDWASSPDMRFEATSRGLL
jgi:hypothetical protein